MNSNLLSAILQYGELCRQELLLNGRNEEEFRNRLLVDWYEALRFFLGHAYFQGRSDTLSARFYEAMWEVLDPALLRTGRNLDVLDLELLQRQLIEQVGRARVGKKGDIKMVISTLQFLRRISEWNIVRYSVGCIEAGNIEYHYHELQNQGNPNKQGIFQVAQKIAAFYLRDVVSLYQLEDKVPIQAKYCLQPVDTWVRQVAEAEKVGLIKRGATNQQIQQAIVETCTEYNCSFVQFNQGVWYLGAHTFDLLLENLQTHGI